MPGVLGFWEQYVTEPKAALTLRIAVRFRITFDPITEVFDKFP